MDTARATLSRESICVTCLSQDRKLFPVNDKTQALFLNLFERDKLCWECHQFVVKMAAFRRRALWAQALLARSLLGYTNVTKIISLSRLAWTPVYVDIISSIEDQHQEPDPLEIDAIKTDSVKEENENTFYECPNGDPGNTYNKFNDVSCREKGDVMLPVLNNREAKSDENACGEAVDDDSLLNVSSKQREANEGSCGKTKGDDTDGIAKASLKPLLNRNVTEGIANSSCNPLLYRKDTENIASSSFNPLLYRKDTGDIANSSFNPLLYRKDTEDIANSSFNPLLYRNVTEGIANSSCNPMLYRKDTEDIANSSFNPLLYRKDTEDIANSSFNPLLYRKDTGDIANSSFNPMLYRKDTGDIANSSFNPLLYRKDTVDIANSSFNPLLYRKDTEDIANSSFNPLLYRKDTVDIANSSFNPLLYRKETEDIANSSFNPLLYRKDTVDIANSSFNPLLYRNDTVDIANSSFNPLLYRKDTVDIANSSFNPLLYRKDTEDIANSSFNPLLSRKSILIDIPPLAKNCKDSTMTVEIEEINKISQEKKVTVMEADKQIPADLNPMYTEKIMTEEEMLEWRERKKNVPYYALHRPQLRCKQCIEPFEKGTLYKAHMRKHEEEFGAFPCLICGVRSLTGRALSIHTSQHYSLLTCKVCGHEWDSPNAMRQHGRVAHGIPITQWDCDQCDKKYPTERKLKRHDIAHRDSECGVCGERFTRQHMPTHMLTHKGPRSEVTCGVCGRKCKSDRTLAAHMRNHDDKVDEAAFCVECNMQFKTMMLYRRHMRCTLKHAGTEDLPYNCDECGKGFILRGQLKSHIDGVHSRELRYKCGVCGEMFKTRMLARRHERIQHEGFKRVKDKICDYCGKAFKEKSTLLGHINSHTGARPFACRLCDATFGYQSALYLHGRLKHKIKKKNQKKDEDNTLTEQARQDT